MRALLVFATLCSALGAAPAAAESERRVGIVVTTLVNVSAERARELASTLGEVLHERLVVDIIAGAETERRLPPGGVPAGCVADDDCRQDLGRRLDTEELLLLVVVGAGPRLKVDPTWVNVASGKITSRPAIEIGPGADVRAVLGTAAPTLLPHLTARDQRRGPEVVVVTTGGGGGGGGGTGQGGRRLRPATLVVAGVSAGALIGASVFGLSSQRKFEALEQDECRRMPCDPREVDSLRRDTILADVFFGVAVVTAGAALTMYLLDDGDPPAARTDQPSVNVGPGPGALGLSLGGVF